MGGGGGGEGAREVESGKGKRQKILRGKQHLGAKGITTGVKDQERELKMKKKSSQQLVRT